MEVPESLDAWTFDTVLEVVERHEFEPGSYDYKIVLSPRTEEERQNSKAVKDLLDSIRHTTCAMANSDGGYILFGVRDRKQQVAKPRDRIVGISSDYDLRREYGKKIQVIDRNVYFDARAIALPTNSANCIFVVHVPPSPLRPHMCEGIFYFRGQGGTAERMNYYLVRDQMLYTEGRLQKIRLLRMELATFRQIRQLHSDPVTNRLLYDTGTFKMLLADVCDLLPSRSGLLALLHVIATRAETLNSLIVQASTPPTTYSTNGVIFGIHETTLELIQRIPNDDGELSNLCGEAEERLARVFGPLEIM